MDSAFGLFIWAACMLAGMLLGIRRDRMIACVALAVLLGPLGVMLALFVPPKVKGEAMRADSTRRPATADRLTELKALRTAGHVSEDEYTSKRKAILAEL